MHSLRDFWRHFGLCRAAAHSDCCFFAPCTNILTYLLTYFPGNTRGPYGKEIPLHWFFYYNSSSRAWLPCPDFFNCICLKISPICCCFVAVSFEPAHYLWRLQVRSTKSVNDR